MTLGRAGVAHGVVGYQDYGPSLDDIILGLGVQYINPAGWEADVEYIFDNDVAGSDSFAVQLRHQLESRPEWDVNIGFGDDERFFVGVRYTNTP